MTTRRNTRSSAALCAGLFVLCELISRPWAEMGMIDDWSYVRSSEVLARTGHIVYNGWATALIGWQLYLGALFVRLFGDSFTAVRLSNILLATAIAYLTQRILVRLGLNAWNATLGTLILVLSPLFLPLAATFMTDIPGLFAILICLYGCLRAMQASSDNAAIGWIIFAVLTNVICGSSRQIAWLGVLTLVPCALWLMRPRRRVFIAGIPAALAGVALILAATAWFKHQPYSIPESSFLTGLQPATIAMQVYHALLTLSLLLLPVTVYYLGQARSWPRPVYLGIAALALLLLLARLVFARHHFGILAGSLTSDLVGPHASYESSFLLGQPPLVLARPLQYVFSLLAVCLLFATPITAAVRLLRTPQASSDAPGLKQVALLLGPFVCCYFLALAHRASELDLSDRYLLPLLFMAAAALLRLYQDTIRPRLPSSSLALLALIAFYGVLCTHNTFALARARVALANETSAAGIPLSDVYAGWEQDLWVEVQRYSYINDPRLRVPAGAYNPALPHEIAPCPSISGGFAQLLRPAHHRFVVSFQPHLCGEPTSVAPVHVLVWPLLHPATLYLVQYPSPPDPSPRDDTPLR